MSIGREKFSYVKCDEFADPFMCNLPKRDYLLGGETAMQCEVQRQRDK